MAISQKRIAEMLGITQATVSRALNDHPRISPELKRRVRAICDEVGYVPDFSASSLASGRTRYISVLMPSQERLVLSDLHSAWVTHLHEAALKRDYRLRVDHFSAYDRTAQEKSADGFVVIGANPIVAAKTANCPVPVVFTDCSLIRPTGTVAIDNSAGVASAVRHLLDLGHRTIGYFGSFGYASQMHPGLERLMGYTRAMNESGFPVSSTLVVETDRYLGEVDEVCEFSDNIMGAVAAGATAFVSASDIAAIGLIRVLKSHGYHVPGDISVIGFDDGLLARSWDPPLTTVRQDLEPASEAAISMLVEMMNGGQPLASVLIPSHLIVRGTTGKVS